MPRRGADASPARAAPFPADAYSADRCRGASAFNADRETGKEISASFAVSSVSTACSTDSEDGVESLHAHKMVNDSLRDPKEHGHCSSNKEAVQLKLDTKTRTRRQHSSNKDTLQGLLQGEDHRERGKCLTGDSLLEKQVSPLQRAPRGLQCCVDSPETGESVERDRGHTQDDKIFPCCSCILAMANDAACGGKTW